MNKSIRTILNVLITLSMIGILGSITASATTINSALVTNNLEAYGASAALIAQGTASAPVIEGPNANYGDPLHDLNFGLNPTGDPAENLTASLNGAVMTGGTNAAITDVSVFPWVEIGTSTTPSNSPENVVTGNTAYTLSTTGTTMSLYQSGQISTIGNYATGDKLAGSGLSWNLGTIPVGDYVFVHASPYFVNYNPGDKYVFAGQGQTFETVTP
jgi:hypothetical protein